MKSNIIKYIIAFFLVVGCVATTTETKAFTIDEVAVVDSIDLNSASSIAIPLCFFYGENVLPAGSWVGS
ncbi:hypothetical protein IJU97_01495 [bacterium]|nr:hypothetical protein [bacterium]